MKTIRVGNLTLGGKRSPLFVIAGPCVIENEKMVLQTAARLGRYLWRPRPAAHLQGQL